MNSKSYGSIGRLDYLKSGQSCDSRRRQTEIPSLSSAFEEINWTIDSLIDALIFEPKKLSNSIILIGGIIIGLGLVFIAQSSSLLGPSSSFMYNNADWTTYGSIVVAIGIVMCSIGLLTRFARRPQK